VRSPRFDAKKETIPSFRPEDYANRNDVDCFLFRCLHGYVGIILASA